jgi:hypothetical protein
LHNIVLRPGLSKYIYIFAKKVPSKVSAIYEYERTSGRQKTSKSFIYEDIVHKRAGRGREVTKNSLSSSALSTSVSSPIHLTRYHTGVFEVQLSDIQVLEKPTTYFTQIIQVNSGSDKPKPHLREKM